MSAPQVGQTHALAMPEASGSIGSKRGYSIIYSTSVSVAEDISASIVEALSGPCVSITAVMGQPTLDTSY